MGEADEVTALCFGLFAKAVGRNVKRIPVFEENSFRDRKLLAGNVGEVVDLSHEFLQSKISNERRSVWFLTSENTSPLLKAISSHSTLAHGEQKIE